MPSGVELRQQDATQNPYDSEFDVVGAFDVIEHVEDAPAVLAGMYKALKPGQPVSTSAGPRRSSPCCCRP